MAWYVFSVMIAAGVHDYANYFLDKMSTHREWRRNWVFWNPTVDLSNCIIKHIFQTENMMVSLLKREDAILQRSMSCPMPVANFEN